MQHAEVNDAVRSYPLPGSDAKKQGAVRPFEHIVIPRHTTFKMPPETSNPSIQEIYAALVVDESRVL